MAQLSVCDPQFIYNNSSNCTTVTCISFRRFLQAPAKIKISDKYFKFVVTHLHQNKIYVILKKGIQPVRLKFRHQLSQLIAVLLFFHFTLTIKKVIFTLEHGMNA